MIHTSMGGRRGRWASGAIVAAMTGAVLASPVALGISSAATTSLSPTRIEAVSGGADCVPFSYTATAGDTLSVTAHEDNGRGTSLATGIGFCLPTSGTNPVNLGGAAVLYAAGVATDTRARTMAAATETYGLRSAVGATGTVTIVNSAPADAGSNQSTIDFIDTPISNTQVALSASAPTYSITGRTASFDVTASAIDSPTDAVIPANAAQDALNKAAINGAPLFDATISYRVTSGPNVMPINTRTDCGSTDDSGTVTCTLPTVPFGTTTSDQVTFFINGLGSTGGPDSNEPQTFGTAQYGSETGAPINYNRVIATCPTPNAAPQAINTIPGETVFPFTPAVCTVPTSQHNITFTANVANGVYAAGQTNPPTIHANYTAVVGAPVHFAVFAITAAGTSPAPTTGDSITNANGDATFTISNSNPAAGDHFAVLASVQSNPFVTFDPPIGGSEVPGDVFEATGIARANYGSALPAIVTVTPLPGQDTFGGTATFKVLVTDAVGTPIPGELVEFAVAGRNNFGFSNAHEGTTGADGTVTLSYTDADALSTNPTDTVTVQDMSTGVTGSANIAWIPGSNAASKIAVDVSGLCNTASPSATNDPAATPSSPAGNKRNAAGIEVCGLVTNAAGLPLISQTVTYTVDKGYVSLVPAFSTGNGKTVTTTTDGSGVVRAFVSSGNAGDQKVTLADGTVTGSGTVTYEAPNVDEARVLTLTPSSATIGVGGTQRFTALVVNAQGDPVPGVSVGFTQSGPGALSALSAAGVVTDANGDAFGDITVPGGITAMGTGGSIVATITSASTQCTDLAGNPTGSTAGTCTATSTYTVGAATTTGPTSLALSASSGTHAGHHETVTATVKNTDGSMAVNAVVRFTVSGANNVSGSATTNTAGVATFSYAANKGGTDTISAFVDINNDGAAQTTEPKASTTAKILLTSETPTMHIVKHSGGDVTVHVITHPALKNAVVHFYSLTARGHQTLIGSKKTGHLGHTSRTFGFHTPGLNHGQKFEVRVRVVHNGHVVSHYSHTRTIQE